MHVGKVFFFLSLKSDYAKFAQVQVFRCPRSVHRIGRKKKRTLVCRGKSSPLSRLDAS